MKQRLDGRSCDQLRPIKTSYGVCGNAAGSVLFELGDTKVLCTVTLQEGVPHFLRGKKTGWLTAEYSMLPAATLDRTIRESSSMKRCSRSLEISRLIGRCLRSVVNLEVLGERTLYFDCDVIQADGGTRTAALTGAYCALRYALDTTLSYIDKKKLLKEPVAAISVGYFDTTYHVDLNYQEDVAIDADFNFVMTASGAIVEIQGTSEKQPLAWSALQAMTCAAQKAIKQIIERIEQDFLPAEVVASSGFTLAAALGQKEK